MSDILFDSACASGRPVRLSEPLRQWAWESLRGRYGDEAFRYDSIAMDDIPGYQDFTPIDQYDLAIERIAREAPLRHVPGEPVSGAATLGAALRHYVPVRLKGALWLESVSHLTMDFAGVVAEGLEPRHQLVKARLAEAGLDAEERRFLESADRCFNAMRRFHQRYLDFLADKAPNNAARLRQVPFGPARNFREALQSVWFTFAFARLCGNWPGIGRLDQMLQPFLDQDLRDGVLTMEEAREALAGFMVKGCEWVRSDTPPGSGDAQNYQNLVLAGIDADGREVAGAATRLILDVVEELPIGDFPITLRLNEQTPPWLKEQAARIVRHGGGVLAFYNEPLIIRALTAFGYDAREVRGFANDGCWETQIPGRTHFRYFPFDSLNLLLRKTLRLGEATPAHFDSYADLREAYRADMEAQVEAIFEDNCGRLLEHGADGAWRWARQPGQPCTVVSLLEGGCIESGRSYREGGATYTVMAPHIGGAPDAGNSLYAIDRLCFQERKVSFDQLMRMLQNNWEGEEALRQYVLRRYTYYGNDADDADAYTADVLSMFADSVERLRGRTPILFPAGVSTFGRQIGWAEERSATPFGRRAGEILSGNTSPTPGTDLAGATAVIASYCKGPMERMVNGAALDVKLSPSAVAGENGLQALVSLMDGFLALGGYFIQLDVLDAETLRRAQEDPESYRTLSVRVSGWNARFITLDRSWQQMIIERTQYGL